MRRATRSQPRLPGAMHDMSRPSLSLAPGVRRRWAVPCGRLGGRSLCSVFTTYTTTWFFLQVGVCASMTWEAGHGGGFVTRLVVRRCARHARGGVICRRDAMRRPEYRREMPVPRASSYGQVPEDQGWYDDEVGSCLIK